MKQYEFISKNEADTKQLAKKLAAKLKDETSAVHALKITFPRLIMSISIWKNR